jgi:uncharacterized repeat protein (TIGR01451 family)
VHKSFSFLFGLKSRSLRSSAKDQGQATLSLICKAFLFLCAAFCVPISAQAANCGPATTQGTAPPGWQTYCWLDLSTYNDTTARTTTGQNFSVTLTDGAILTFNLKTTPITAPAVIAIAAPSWTGAAVGNTAFLGIPGKPILYSQAGGTDVFTISNILIAPPLGAPAVSAYAFVAADAESTNNGESLKFVTNGGNWTILDQVDPISGTTYPTISGTGTNTFTETGVAGTVGGYIVASNSPTTVTTTMVSGGLQGVMFAVRFASIRLNKTITGARVNAADQFKFNIKTTTTGAILGSGTTTGTGNGPFAAAAVSLASGVALTLDETMATGSVTSLNEYDARLTCTNSSTSSTVMPTNLATTSYSFGALQFGDSVQCVFNNTPFPHLRLQKALGAVGRQFAGDQFNLSISNGPTTVASTTTTGTGAVVATGATAMTQVATGVSYSLAEAASGTTLLSQYTATMSCVNAAGTSTTTLPTTVPGIIAPVMGDVITCTITNTGKGSNATLLLVKSSSIVSDPINGTTNPKAIPGAIILYSISATNSGPTAVDANTVVITDPLPTNVTFDATTGVAFANGTPTSGLTGITTSYSNQAGGVAPYTYTPTAGFDGNVKGIRVSGNGTMAPSTGASAQPNFTITFRARVN